MYIQIDKQWLIDGDYQSIPFDLILHTVRSKENGLSELSSTSLETIVRNKIT